MIFNILNSGFDTLTEIVLLVALPIIILFSLAIHEYAHAAVSSDLGDPTPKLMGRLTLNPFKHLHPIGTLCMLFFGFGWANPVPVDPRHYKNPKKGMALCGVAGPAINLLIGLHAYAAYYVMVWFAEHPAILSAAVIMRFIPEILYVILAQLFGLIGYYNVLLAIFNLLPIPPFDGSRLLYAFLPDRHYFGVMKYEGLIMMVMLFLLLIGVFDVVIAGVHTGVSFCVEQTVRAIMDGIYRLIGAIK